MRTVKPVLHVLAAVAATKTIVSGASTPRVNTNEIPSWYLNTPTSKTTNYTVGSAKKQALQLARNITDASARQEQAQEAQTQVKAGIQRYLQQSGPGNYQQTLNSGQSLNEQISKAVLGGAAAETRSM